jgi:hypothetical protein
MNSSFYRFILDVQTEQSQTSIPVALYDTAVTLYMTLTDGGKPYVIDRGCLAKLVIARPDGTKSDKYCRIEGEHTVVYDFTETTAIISGIHECELTIYGVGGEQITSPRFMMVVNERVANKDAHTGVNQDDLDTLDQISEWEAARRSAEELRVEAEESRVSAEEGRVEGEALRASAEQGRESAEAGRVANYQKINADTSETVRKILREQESIIALQKSLIENGTTQERLAEIIALQKSYIGGNAT